MPATRLKLLEDMAIFGGIAEESLEFVLALAPVVSIPAGGYFFRESDPGTSMYVLERGRVEVSKSWAGENHVLAYLGTGACFGEMALIDFCRRSASVRAVEDCHAIEISVNTLHELYEHDLEQYLMIQMNMGREVSRRLRSADQRLFRARVTADGKLERHDTYTT